MPAMGCGLLSTGLDTDRKGEQDTEIYSLLSGGTNKWLELLDPGLLLQQNRNKEAS